MAALEIKDNGNVRWVPLDKPTLRIGRASECDIRLDASNEKASRKHAEVRIADDGVHLVDLNSKTGTYLGTVRVTTEVRLSDGDSFRIGNTTITFHSSDSPDSAAQEGGMEGEHAQYSTTVTITAQAHHPQPFDLDGDIPLAPDSGDLRDARRDRPTPTPPPPTAGRRVPKQRSAADAEYWIIWLQWLLKTAAVVGILAAVPGGIWWYRHNAKQEARSIVKAEQDRQSQLFTEAHNAVDALLGQLHFRDAREEVYSWRNKGLKGEHVETLTLKVDRSAKGQAGKWLEEARKALEQGDLKRADELTYKAREMEEEFGFRGGRTLDELQRSIAEARSDRLSKQGREKLSEAFSLLEASEFDEALRAMKSALGMIPDENDRTYHEKKFKEKLGARIKIGDLPSGAYVLLEGRTERFLSGAVISGLLDGSHKGVAYCDHYLPYHFELVARYPEVSPLVVPMVRVAERELWAINALKMSGQPCVPLVLRYYKSMMKDERLLEVIFRSYGGIPDISSMSKLDDKELDDRVPKTLESKGTNHVILLNALARLAGQSRSNSSDPFHGLDVVLKSKPALARIRLAVEALEAGCARCMGLGGPMCENCGGEGKGPAKVKCSNCQGTSLVKCKKCSGDGWAICSACKGSGRAKNGKNGRRCKAGCAPEVQIADRGRGESEKKYKEEERKKINKRPDGEDRHRTREGNARSEFDKSTVTGVRKSHGFPCDCGLAKIQCTKCKDGFVAGKSNDKCPSCTEGLCGTCIACTGKKGRTDMTPQEREQVERIIAGTLPSF